MRIRALVTFTVAGLAGTACHADCTTFTTPLVIQPADLIDPGAPQWAQFGASVAASDDVIIVGAPSRWQGTYVTDGAAYVYRRVNGAWTFSTRVLPPGAPPPGPGRAWGQFVACGPDYFLVGGNYNTAVAEGVWNAAMSEWTLVTPTAPNNVRLGNPALASGGLAVGRFQDYDNFSGINVFEESSSQRGVWSQLGRLMCPTSIIYQDHLQNQGVSCGADGPFVVVGGTTDVDVAAGGGAAAIFERTSAGFVLRQKLVTPTGAQCGAFGRAVAISGDTIAVGGYADAQYSNPGLPLGVSCPLFGPSGFVAIYDRDLSAPQPTWQISTILRKPTGSPSATDGFGAAVALRGDRLAVGAYRDNTYGLSAGAVYLYRRVDGQWRPSATLGALDSGGANLGSQVVFAGDDIVASAPGYAQLGAVVVFGPCSTTPDPATGVHCLPGIWGLYTYLNAWFLADPFADYNRDGHLTVQDLMDFFNAWIAGCP